LRCQNHPGNESAKLYNRVMRANALRSLVAVSPEMQAC
jgi:hypothetical protein